jgi:predicted metal-dependent hydrolase
VTSSTDHIQYGDTTIEYSTRRSDRKTLAVRVEPDQTVEVRAPNDASDDAVREKVRKRARWILEQQRYFDSFVRELPPREYVSGETHRYMGRQYRLKVIQIEDEASERVKLKGPYFRIYTHQKGNREHVKTQLDEWYRAHAKVKFSERLEEASTVMRKYGVEKPPMQVRRMKMRWGSCTPSGRILLNLDLIRAPRLCIDYVIAHELCHLKYPSHGTEFYNLLSRVMPDWKEIKARLREVQF